MNRPAARGCPIGTIPDDSPDHEFIGCYSYLVNRSALWRANLDGFDRHGERRHSTGSAAQAADPDQHNPPNKSTLAA